MPDSTLTDRTTQLKNGPGNASIRSLTNALTHLAKNNLTDTPEYKEKQALLSLQKIGTTIGPTIDINTTNKEQIDLLRTIAENTRSLASIAPDSTSSLNNASGPAIFLP